MAPYIVKRPTFLFPDADAFKAAVAAGAAPAGTPFLEAGTRFDGKFSSASNQLIDKIDVPKGVIDQNHLLEVPAVLPPITTDLGRSGFCWVATNAALAEKADRNYLVSVAYYLSSKLNNFGNPAEQRVGPFRYSGEEWFAAVKKANKDDQVIDPEGLFDPAWQVTLAAIRTGEKMKEFAAAHDNRLPTPVELFFYERLGEEALTLLKQDPTKPCSAAFDAPPRVGTYAADIKDRKSGEVIKEVTDGLKAGFTASRADVAQLERHMRFFSDEDSAPWLTVARLMTSQNVALEPTKLAGTFVTFPPALGPADRRSAAFVSFCLIECGVAEAKDSVPKDNKAGLPDTWKEWSKEAEAPLRPGAIVVTKPEDGKVSVGILAETPKDTNYKVYFCSEDGTISVGVKPTAKDKVETLRWLDITGSAVAIDPALLASASTEIRGTLEKAQRAFTALVKDGWTKPQALGIVASIRGESNFNEHITGDTDTPQPSHGLCQWRASRRTDFRDKFGIDITNSTFEQQLEFITFEMNHKENKAGDALKRATTLIDAARIVCTDYERSRDTVGDTKKRQGWAEAYSLVLR